MLEKKRNEGFEAEVDFGKWDRSAQVIALYGYNFIDTLEELWDRYTEDTVKNIDRDMVPVIREHMNRKLKRAFYNGNRRWFEMSKFNLKQKLVIAGIVVVIVVLAIAVIVSR